MSAPQSTPHAPREALARRSRVHLLRAFLRRFPSIGNENGLLFQGLERLVSRVSKVWKTGRGS